MSDIRRLSHYQTSGRPDPISETAENAILTHALEMTSPSKGDAIGIEAVC